MKQRTNWCKGNKYYEILSKEENYNLDIKGIQDSVIEFFEVETKTSYAFTNQEDFIFPTVSFLIRKEKWKIYRKRSF